MQLSVTSLVVALSLLPFYLSYLLGLLLELGHWFFLNNLPPLPLGIIIISLYYLKDIGISCQCQIRLLQRTS
jgi:hypothetical protein